MNLVPVIETTLVKDKLYQLVDRNDVLVLSAKYGRAVVECDYKLCGLLEQIEKDFGALNPDERLCIKYSIDSGLNCIQTEVDHSKTNFRFQKELSERLQEVNLHMKQEAFLGSFS